MLKNLSIRVKLFVLITLVVVITFGVVAAIVSHRSIEMAEEDAFILAEEMSARYSFEVKSELEAARATSESLMTVFQTLIERNEAERDTLNAILQNSLEQKEYIISFCVAFEPNGLDGKDALYAGQYPLYDDTGRYAPYWSMYDGVLGVEPLADFDNDDWYAGARDSGKEYITDPFIFEVQGTPVLMTSLVFPIMIDGEFVGIVSSDMALDSLQDMVSQVNTSGLGEYTEIYSNSGLVVAHPDDQYFNRSVFATSAYNLLVSEPSRAREALELAQAYVESLPAENPDDPGALAEYESSLGFVEGLSVFADDASEENLDLSLLTDALAKAILQLDQRRLQTAEAVTNAIALGETYTVTEDGYYKIYTPISFSEATNPWSVAVSVPLSEVQQRSHDLSSYVLLISVLGVVLIALVLYLVTRNLTKPILDLAESAKQVGEGNFALSIPESRSNDEVGTLSTAFSTMVEQINELVGELTQKSKELEKKNEYLAELNELLIEARDEAEASNRAKSVFLSNMSHEMRTPLNAIMGMTILGQKTEDGEKKNAAFKKIEDASVRLLALINDVLDMSRIETERLVLTPTSFTFRDTIDQAIATIQPDLQAKRQTGSATLDKQIPSTLVGDEKRLLQVLANLLSNAVKFTDEEGEVTLTAFVKEHKGNQCTLQFEVSDTGIGISPEQQDKLFNLFEQADNSASRSFGGAGLGLALSKRLVELMGGTIWVASKPGEGSTFYFTVQLTTEDERTTEAASLPKATTGEDTTSAASALQAPVADEGCIEELSPPLTGSAQQEEDDAQTDFSEKRILLAEDIDINREIVLAMLESTKVQIDCANNGKEAFELFRANPEAFDLILMDIQMPIMDGIEATQHIRELDKEIPIIALTANVFEEEVDSYLQGGMNDFIEKPLDYAKTITLLERYLLRL